MNKEKIFTILGNNAGLAENANGSAVVVNIESDDLNVAITIPYEVNEIFYEASSKEGKVLIKDWRDYYGESEEDDIQEDLMDITEILKNPKLRLSSNGSSVEAFGNCWYYFFGEFIGPDMDYG